MLGDVLKRKGEEERVKRQGRLPPGQSLTLRFPVLHYGPVPSFDPATWDLRIFGQVEETQTWDWGAFQQLPRRKITMDIHCVTRWSKFDCQWEGVSLGELVESGVVRPRPSARFLMQHCENGFSVNIPLDLALSDSFLLATHYDGQPLTPEHGYPLRGILGVIPGRQDLKGVYFWKGGKWLRGLEFMDEDRLGFWEQAGYHNEADIWKEQRLAQGW
jgi:DMSO/TMAO reductase YedYZ molybdopterin-dependent catalytic subunit